MTNDVKHWQDDTFIDEIFGFMDSEQGQHLIIISDAIEKSLADVDAKNRKLIWKDGQALTLTESIKKLAKENHEFPIRLLQQHLISWLEMDFSPENYTQAQIDELDELTGQWIDEYESET